MIFTELLTMMNFETVYTDFNQVLANFKAILYKSDRPEANEYKQKLAEEQKVIRENPVLRVAFIGQYSAGKSTIISALTGNRNISIGADITTDKATPYSWNGIEIMDTPGIGTERQDHDEVTYHAIERADLLVFCTTHQLLDSHLINHFRKLAYEKCYGNKMMLVFNKLSSEAGEDDQKIANYKASMMQGLHPHSLDEFKTCFLDAKDYCEGVDEEDEELIELSRFEIFIEALNSFVQQQGKTAQLTTPIRRTKGYTEEIEQWFFTPSVQDERFLTTLSRIKKRIRNEKQDLNLRIKRMILNVDSQIRNLGSDFANDFPNFKNQAELDTRKKEIELFLECLWIECERDMQKEFDNVAETLRDEVSEIFNSDLFNQFIATLEAEFEVGEDSKGKDPNWRFAKDNWKVEADQVRLFQYIATQLGLDMASKAVGPLAKVPVLNKVLGEGAKVAGSELHQIVFKVGKSVGFKFQPWQAVGIAKNIGKAAKFAGPLVGILAFSLDMLNMAEQKRKEQELREAQGKIDNEFAKISEQLGLQLKEQVKCFETECLDYLEMQLRSEERKYQEQKLTDASQMIALRKVQEQLDNLLKELT